MERSGIFIGWAGEKAMMVAEALRIWLSILIQESDPFASPVDIPRGARWNEIIAGRLAGAGVGVLCVTRDNRMSAWLNFEAGALQPALVVPFLIGMQASELDGPLQQFQAVVSHNRDDVFGMVCAIRDALGLQDRLDREVLRSAFDALWPMLKTRIDAARNNEEG